MAWGFTNVTPTSGQVVTTNQAKLHLSIALSEHDWNDHIDNLITAATEFFQTETRRQLLTSVDDFIIDEFPPNDCALYIPRHPLASVTSVKYNDENETEQTWAASNYIVHTRTMPGMITLDEGTIEWPSTAIEAKGGTIRLTTGYGAASAVPQIIKQCILMIVHEWFHFPMGPEKHTVGLTAQRIIDQHKLGDTYFQYPLGTGRGSSNLSPLDLQWRYI